MSDFDLVVNGNAVDARVCVRDGWVGVRGGKVAARGVPCRKGRSHCAEGSITPAHLLDGVRVLYHTISTLDTTLAAARR